MPFERRLVGTDRHQSCRQAYKCLQRLTARDIPFGELILRQKRPASGAYATQWRNIMSTTGLQQLLVKEATKDRRSNRHYSHANLPASQSQWLVEDAQKVL